MNNLLSKKYLISGIVIMLLIPSLVIAQQNIKKGIVRNATNSEGIPSVSIHIKGFPTGTLSDENGFFELKIPEIGKDSIVLIISCLGYYSLEQTIHPTLSLLSVYLSPEARLLT